MDKDSHRQWPHIIQRASFRGLKNAECIEALDGVSVGSYGFEIWGHPSKAKKKRKPVV